MFDECLVVGSSGAFGRAFTKILTSQGSRVVGVDVVDGGDNVEQYANVSTPAGREKLLEFLDTAVLVLLTVPEPEVVRFIEAYAGRLRDDALVVDIASAKSRVVEAAKKSVACEYLSIHPMFGPKDTSLEGNIVTVSVASGPQSSAFEQILRLRGGQIVSMTAPMHDRCASVAQVMCHVMTLAFVEAMADAEVQPSDLVAMTTPVLAHFAAAAHRVTCKQGAVYWEIQQNNPFAGLARHTLSKAIAKVDQIIDAGEIAPFLAMFDRAQALDLPAMAKQIA